MHVRGITRRSGARGVSVRGVGAWDMLAMEGAQGEQSASLTSLISLIYRTG